MAKYSIQITRVDEYEVEVDEKVWTPEEIEKWRKSFYPAIDTEDIAKHLAYAVMQNGSGNGFMEGFGIVKTFRQDGSVKTQFKGDLKKVVDSDYAPGLSIKPISEEEDFDHEISTLH